MQDGGYAFPLPAEHVINPGKRHLVPYEFTKGMTLRDYFAAQAMAAYLASPTTCRMATDHADMCAEWAYLQADAMLAERSKRKDGQ